MQACPRAKSCESENLKVKHGMGKPNNNNTRRLTAELGVKQALVVPLQKTS